MNKQKATLVFLGASNFKNKKLTSRDAFLNSKLAIENYFKLQSTYQIVETVDLFNKTSSATRQLTEIDKHFEKIDADYLFLIYIGHGEFRTNTDDYFWSIAATNGNNPFATSIDVKTLGHSLRKLRRTTKCICIVDCCFSAATAGALMSSGGLGAEVDRRTKNAISASQGTVVISSSAVNDVSYISNEEEITLFTRSFINITSGNSAQTELFLNSIDIVRECESWMLQTEPDIATSPQVIAPYQKGSPLIEELIFPVLTGSDSTSSTPEKASEQMVTQKKRSEHYPSQDELHEISSIVTQGEKLERELIQSIDKSSIKEQLYAYYARTKGVVSVARKIERKRIAKEREKDPEKYLVSNVTDIVGVRLITLFRDDTAGVLEALCKLLVGANGARAEISRLNPFQDEPQIKEARAYYADTFPGAHAYAVEAQEILATHFEKSPHDITVEVIEKDEYSSVHIVLNTTIVHGSEEEESSVVVPIEFQIRSVFEDAWAQVDHKLRYTKTRVSSDSGGTSTSYVSVREQIPPGAERSLKLLKRFLDNSGDLADIIRDQVDDSVSVFSIPTPSMDSADDFSRIIETLGGNPNDFKDFQSKLLKKDEFDKKYSELGSIALADPKTLKQLRQSYGKLAEDLNSLFEIAKVRQDISKFRITDDPILNYYYYSLRMEEAFCRVFSAAPNDSSEVREAKNIYVQLLPDFNDHPPLHYRLGQAYKTLGDINKAIESMSRCIKFLETGNYQAGEFDQRVSAKQYRTMIDSSYRLLAFYYWTKGKNILHQSDPDNLPSVTETEVLKLYDQAVEKTQIGLLHTEEENLLRTINNIVAYLNDVIALKKLDDLSELSVILKSMKDHSYTEYFEQFKGLIDPHSELLVNHLETLATGYKFLGIQDNAKAVAQRIIDVIRTRNLIASGEIPAAEIQEILNIALEILSQDHLDK